MNFTEQTRNIINGVQSKNEKSIILSNLLAPKIMYVPFPQVADIQKLLLDFQTQFLASSPSYYLLEVIIFLFEYKRSNYHLAIKNIQSLNKSEFLRDIPRSYQAASYTVLGASYRSLGEKEASLEHFQQVVEIYGQTPKMAYEAYFGGLAMYHIAEIYGELKDYREMLNRHSQFIDFAQTTHNIDFENRAYNGIGRAYQALGDFQNALKYLKLADANSQKAGNIPFKARNLHDVGNVYFKILDYKNALIYFEQALEVRKDYGLTNATVTTLMGMSKVKTAQQKYNESIELLLEALSIALPLKVNKKIYLIYQNLSVDYERIGNFQKALDYYREFHLLKSELDNVDKSQVENQKIREKNTQLQLQKEVIENQKQQIEITLNKLQENVKYLENFAAVAAHDLKAPIRIAVNFTQLLQRRFKGVLEDDMQDFIHFITHNVSQLSQMIDDLLLLSKLGHHLPSPQVINLNQVIKQVNERLSEKISVSKAQIIIQDELPNVLAHDSLITQLFQNIIDNAIKYKSNSLAPQIFISHQISDNPYFSTIEIKDNGQGIAKKLQPYIFELFNRSNRNDSSGIGLATCKKIVNHYGGKIWAKSTENEGTSFFFTLPLANLTENSLKE